MRSAARTKRCSFGPALPRFVWYRLTTCPETSVRLFSGARSSLAASGVPTAPAPTRQPKKIQRAGKSRGLNRRREGICTQPNGEVEEPRIGAGSEPRVHTLSQHPRRHYRASRTPPTIVRFRRQNCARNHAPDSAADHSDKTRDQSDDVDSRTLSPERPRWGICQAA